MEQQALPPPTPSYNDLKYFFFVTWEGGGWCDVSLCTPEYFKPFTSCKMVLWIFSGKEDLNVKVVSTQTTESMAKWSGGERVVPCSYSWKKQVQAPNLEGRRPFEVKNKEISKLKSLGYVLYHVVGSMSFPSPQPGFWGSLPSVPLCRQGPPAPRSAAGWLQWAWCLSGARVPHVAMSKSTTELQAPVFSVDREV